MTKPLDFLFGAWFGALGMYLLVAEWPLWPAISVAQDFFRWGHL